MKRIILIATLALFTYTLCSAQQTNVYRRSSLCTILMDEANMPKRTEILKAFVSTPIPDKYNDHNVGERVFDPKTLEITPEAKQAFDELEIRRELEKIEALERAEEQRLNPEIQMVQAQNDSEEGDEQTEQSKQSAEPTPKKKKKGGGGFLRFVKGAATVASSLSTTDGSQPQQQSSSSFGSSLDQSNIDYAGITAQYVTKQMISKQLFDRWFINKEGEFYVELIKERGKYDASMIDLQTAKGSVRGMGLLEDAGEELIHNTFVVVSRYRYVSKDDLVSDITQITDAAAQASGNQYVIMGAAAAKVTLSASMGAGYYVYITSFLYQLKWDEEIASNLYNNLWGERESYDDSDIFSLKYVGTEKAFANVKAGIFTELNEEELVRIATVNATDAVLAKLEKAYDVFKTKTPLHSIEPLTAHIGMKEGLEAGDKYEVLEQVVDQSTNKTKYVRKAVLTVSKNIWDNRYMADEEGRIEGKEQKTTATEFVGNAKGLYPGILLRQIAK